MTRTAEETAAYYEAKRKEWRADAEAELNAPLRPLSAVCGQESESRGSWALLLEEGPAYSHQIVDGALHYGLTSLPLNTIWDLEDGFYSYKSIVNNGTKGLRFFIERKRRA